MIPAAPQASPTGLTLAWRLPAAFLYLSGPAIASQSWKRLSENIEKRHPELRAAAPGILACTPSERSADLLDTALELAMRLVNGHRGENLLPSSDVVLLVAPGFVEQRGGRLIVDDRDPLVRSLLEGPSLGFPAGIYVTSRAVHSLEGTWKLDPTRSWSTPTLPEVPLQRATPGVPAGPPRWRNPTIFGRPVEWVPRPSLERALGEAVATGRCMVTGPVGCGKSRLLAHVLARSEGPTILTVTPSRAEGTLRDRVLEALARRSNPKSTHPPESSSDSEAVDAIVAESRREPLCLVLDDLQRMSSVDSPFVDAVARAAGTESFRLVLVGRVGIDWPDAAVELPRIEVPPMTADESYLHAARVCHGLEMPEDVMDRFCRCAGGSPFCFEEGILELIHRRALRRIYGSFFFGAPTDIDLTPSPRFVSHLLLEGGRSETLIGRVGLAAAGRAVPRAAIEAAAEAVGRPLEPDWLERTPTSAWLVEAETPWGPGIDFRASTPRSAFDTLLTSDSRKNLRAMIGTWLGTRPDSTPEARWGAYELMAGVPGAARVLLQSLRPLPPPERREAVFAAVCHELAELRRRQGSEGDEIELLWALLPLARRMGRLRDIRSELDRARELCREIPEKLLAISTLLAELDLEDGHPRDAERSLRRALEIAIQSDPKRKPLLGVQLGRLLHREGRHEEARQLLERLREEIESPTSRYRSATLSATCAFFLGNIALAQRRFDDALELHRTALVQRQEQTLENAVGASLCALGATHRALGDYRSALEQFEQARDHLEHHGREGEISFALTGLASIRSRLGQPTLATPLLREAVDLRAAHEGSIGEALARLALAENLLELDQLGGALEEARRAHFRLTLTDDSPHVGRAERVLGRIDLRQNQHESAREHFERARDTHRRLGQEAEVARDLSWLLIEAQERRCLEDVETLVRQLAEVRQGITTQDRGELLDYRVFAALEWLRERGSQLPHSPIQFLRRSYRELLRKTADLDQKQRSTFLMQVPEHQRIVGAATRHQLSLPEYM